jgi:purine-binding chemotaxis protein CheW
MKAMKANQQVHSGIQIVTFRLGEECYGIPVWEVREIIRPMEISPIPGAVQPVEGVINLRGEIIPVINMHPVLGMTASGEEESAKKKRIVILDAEDGGFGFIVDEVMEVVKVASEEVQPPPDVGKEASFTKSILGIVQVSGRMIICLDPRKLISGILDAKDLTTICS